MTKFDELNRKVPLLSIAYNPGEQLPTIINVYHDWEENGEVHIRYVHIDELVAAAKLLNFIVDAVADELLYVKGGKKLTVNQENSDTPL